MSNSLGTLFRINGFGESHGNSLGVVIDGCPAGLPLQESDIQVEVDKRKPAAGSGQTARVEEDRVRILSGLFAGFTTGAPLAMMISNKDTDSSQYEKNRYLPRPGHADYTGFIKYGGFNDYRGGGRFSGRVTAGLVMAGAVAKKILKMKGIEVLACTVQIGKVKAAAVTTDAIRNNVYLNPMRCADSAAVPVMADLIAEAGREGDSLGGVIEGLALNVPVGLGDPVFDTVEGELAKALFAIPAVKGVEFGEGFAAALLKGSENNDAFLWRDGEVITATNHAGGILGGISNGMPLVLRAAIKPTPSISRKQGTVDLKNRQGAEISTTGRHDVCIVPRAVIVVESMMAVTLCDLAARAGITGRIMK
ncbi:MAG: chorismate synthase [Dehalococcoidales bacterium]|nr:chorismate synthase [Dehalococcoidales bacterium]